jgi:hypothetical protein
LRSKIVENAALKNLMGLCKSIPHSAAEGAAKDLCNSVGMDGQACIFLPY